MKRLLNILALALLLIPVSCLKPESERVPEILQITARNADKVGAFNAQISVTVKCDLHWKAELKDDSWGSISVQSVSDGKGGEFVVLLNDNIGEEDRENTIIVKAGKGETSLDFVQPGLSKFFKPRSIELEGTRESSVIFTSPSKWSAELPENPNWVSITSAKGEAGYSRLALRAVDENANLGSRETFAILTIGDYKFNIPVVQLQQDIILSEDKEISLGYKEQEISVATQFNIDYDVDISAPWITRITTKAPLNEGVERFAVEENSSNELRRAVIGFKGGKASPLLLVVEQQGKDRVLSFSQTGIYGLEGMDYIWGEQGWNQRSLLLSPDGSYRLRLLSPSTLTAVELSGIRFDYPEGQGLPAQLKMRRKDFTPYYKDCEITLLQQEGDLYWFKESEGVGIIIKK